MTLRIISLAPELGNVFGDAENARVLAQRAQWAGTPHERVDVAAGGDFPRASLYVIGSATDPQLPEQAAALHAWAAPLRAAIDDGAVVLALGSALELLGSSVQTSGGAEVAGLGLLELRSRAWSRIADDIVLASAWGTLVGFENRDRRVEGEALSSPLGTRLSANEHGEPEGVAHGTLFGTHLQGPVCAKNPDFADRLLTLAALHAGLSYVRASAADSADAHALQAREQVLERRSLA